jgi:hypothetical protein
MVEARTMRVVGLVIERRGREWQIRIWGTREDGTSDRPPSGGSRLAYLIRQRVEKERNLQLIRERKTQFVMSTTVPLQLLKEELRLVKDIDKLNNCIAELRDPEVEQERSSCPGTSL